jgi:hypothetical protein
LRLPELPPNDPIKSRSHANWILRGTGFSLYAFAFVGAGLIPARRREAPRASRIHQSAKLFKEIAFA